MKKHFQTMNIRPKPKQRPRLGRKGRVFTPSATTDFENEIRDLYDGPMFDGPVSVRLLFDTDELIVEIEEMPGSERPKHVRADLDNLQKAVLDGLQGDGGAFVDDKHVHFLSAEMQPRRAA